MKSQDKFIVLDKAPQQSEPENIPEQELTKVQKTDIATYESLFFNSGETSARNGKSVYICPEFHRRIVQIV
ncbi:DUF3408 domain-containing protein [Bergeyella zoohelcum]|uniref:DUF3408 domain-containing protein n=1 Tax=Bergeyella zoohelcum TaxID=1015 RepID=UPI0028893BDD|nr:DUF3408 domain-containing protein [Bergeyella zoohelcum]